MKNQIVLLFTLLFALSGKAQNKTEKFLPDSVCYQLWFVDDGIGGYSGFEFRKNGELKLLNYLSFTGEKWSVNGDHLVLESRWRGKNS